MNAKNSASKDAAEDLLLDLAHQVAAKAVEMLDVNKDIGLQLGQEVANSFAVNYGKQLIYIPCGLSIQVSTRNLEIWAKFTGSNHRDLAKEYGVSLQWLYHIVKEMRKEDRSQGRFNADGF